MGRRVILAIDMVVDGVMCADSRATRRCVVYRRDFGRREARPLADEIAGAGRVIILMGSERSQRACAGDGCECDARVALAIELNSILVVIHREYGEVVRSGVEGMGAFYTAISRHNHLVGVGEAPFAQGVVRETEDRCRVDMHLDPTALRKQ